MIRNWILTVAFIAISVLVYGSSQVPDYIVFGKDTVQTYNLILESYLQKHDTLRANKLLGLSFRDGATTNCWRGYQAIYEIDNDSLFLVAIISCGGLKDGRFDRSQSIHRMNSIFGKRSKNCKVFIDWFDGSISFPLSDRLLRWDGVFYTIFERERVLSISKGILFKAEEVSNYVDSRHGLDRRDKEKIPDVLFRQLAKTRWKNRHEFDCSDRYIIAIGPNGYISEVKMQYSEQEVEKYFEISEYKFCIAKVAKALKPLRFDIIKDKGIPISEEIYLEIWIGDDWTFENRAN